MGRWLVWGVTRDLFFAACLLVACSADDADPGSTQPSIVGSWVPGLKYGQVWTQLQSVTMTLNPDQGGKGDANYVCPGTDFVTGSIYDLSWKKLGDDRYSVELTCGNVCACFDILRFDCKLAPADNLDCELSPGEGAVFVRSSK